MKTYKLETKQILMALVITASTLPLCVPMNAIACSGKAATSGKKVLNKVEQTAAKNAKSDLPQANNNDDAPSLNYPPSEFIITP